MTALVQCTCTSKQAGDAASFQDRTYGHQTRVAVPTAKGDKDNIDVRCTVCNKEQRVPSGRNK